MCQMCLQRLLASDEDHISCPFCRQQFDKKQVEHALRQGCLAFPAHKTPVYTYKEWNDDEEATVPKKRRCLERLQHRVLNRDYINQHLPMLCEQMRHMVGMRLVRLVDTLQKRSFIPAPENYYDKWDLEYLISPAVDPFPKNLGIVVHNLISLFQFCKENPDDAQWYMFIEPYVHKHFDEISLACSLTLRTVIQLIDILRGSHNQGIFMQRVLNVPCSG